MSSQTSRRSPNRNQNQNRNPAQKKVKGSTHDLPATSEFKPQTIFAYQRWMLPLRLFLGITFIYAGLQKLTDPQYFNANKPGYIGKQLTGFAHGSPLHDLLLQLVPHATLVGGLVAFGELAIGLGALLAILLRPASFFGLLISFIFFLTASWHVFPYFYGADIVFCFAWLTLMLAGPRHSGFVAGDTWWVPRVLLATPESLRPGLNRAASILVGVGLPDEALPVVPPTRQQQRNYSYQMQKRASRRNFLWGAFSGVVAAVSVFLIGSLFRQGPSSEGTAPPPTTPTPTSAPGLPTATATTGTGAGTSIGNLNKLTNNSSADFTIPSNGDPGVLVKLNNGKCVAFDATCTHAGCPVSFDPGSGHLLCPCHGAEFDPANNAAVVQGPTNIPLTSVPISIDQASGNITLK